MIDYFALALGHGLLAVALLRLVMNDDLDFDPTIAERQEAERKASADALAERKRVARETARAESEQEIGV